MCTHVKFNYICKCLHIVPIYYCKIGFDQTYKFAANIFGLGCTFMEICCKILESNCNNSIAPPRFLSLQHFHKHVTNANILEKPNRSNNKNKKSNQKIGLALIKS
jgi:hypothetical protein